MQKCGKRPNDSQWQRDECSHADRLRRFQTPPKNSHLRLAELLANRLAVTDPRGRYFFFFFLCLSLSHGMFHQQRLHLSSHFAKLPRPLLSLYEATSKATSGHCKAQIGVKRKGSRMQRLQRHLWLVAAGGVTTVPSAWLLSNVC